MKKLNYISILAGGTCKFNCDFCIGKNIRKKTKPHFSEKWRSFINCFGDMTDLLSVSGDTSDPSFVSEFVAIPSYAKKVNENIKVTLHTRNMEVASVKTSITGYDKHVLSIDEEFFENVNKDVLKGLKENAKNGKLRLSVVLLDYNWAYFAEETERILKELPGVQITFRPNVFEFCCADSFKENLGEWEVKESGEEVLINNPKIWYWDYRKTNPNLDVRYLFSDGSIYSNCRWEKLY